MRHYLVWTALVATICFTHTTEVLAEKLSDLRMSENGRFLVHILQNQHGFSRVDMKIMGQRAKSTKTGKFASSHIKRFLPAVLELPTGI